MNKEQADALCTVIAAGFVGLNEEAGRTNGDPAINFNNRTRFIYQGEEDEVKTMPAFFKITLNGDFYVLPEPMTADAPIIYAKKPGSIDYFENINLFSSFLSEIVNERANDLRAVGNFRFYGAYIGGFYNTPINEFTFFDASKLYFRDWQYGVMTPEMVHTTEEYFVKFNRVSKLVHDELYERRFTLTAVYETESQGLNQNPVNLIAPYNTPYNEPAPRAHNQTLASCHGLVNAIYYTEALADKQQKICVEFSYSDDTSKAASCIPCAIFAAATDQPASYTHFGRGDYWSLPQEAAVNGTSASVTNAWRKYVANCFKKGLLILQQKFPYNKLSDLLNPVFAKYPNNKTGISDAFLDALTFPGSFADKINSTILD
jgi:hypothetical protein